MSGDLRVSGERIDMGAYEYDLTGIWESSQNERFVNIVGNPVTASSYAEIECENVGSLSATVYSLDGKQLVNKTLGISQKGLNRIEIGELFQNLSSGAYLLVITTPKNTFVAKIVKR